MFFFVCFFKLYLPWKHAYSVRLVLCHIYIFAVVRRMVYLCVDIFWTHVVHLINDCWFLNAPSEGAVFWQETLEKIVCVLICWPLIWLDCPLMVETALHIDLVLCLHVRECKWHEKYFAQKLVPPKSLSLFVVNIYSIYTSCPFMSSFFLLPHEWSTLSHFPLSSPNSFLSCKELFVFDLEKKDPLCIKLSYSLGNEYSLAKCRK